MTESGRKRREKTNETMKEKEERLWVQVQVQGQQRGIEMTGEQKRGRGDIIQVEDGRLNFPLVSFMVLS